MAKKDNNKPVEPKTTGHEWDGIQEYDNPVPRWWLWSLVLTVLFSVGYVIYYPAFPLLNGFTKGTAGWSQYKELEESQKYAADRKQKFEAQISGQPVEAILANADMREYAYQAGKSLFAVNCSQCHGAGANGAKAHGYPSLLDDEWLWGGDIESIEYSIRHGIRSYDDEDTRDNVMMAYGKEEVLDEQQINDVVRYIRVLGGRFMDNDASDRGAEVFAENCASCHGEQGEGISEMGAPNLNNHVWLYGGSREKLVETISNGRAGVMPAWSNKLSDDDIRKLTVYVHELGGGQ